VHPGRLPEPLDGEQLRAVDVVDRKGGIRGAAGQRDPASIVVHDEFVCRIAAQCAPDVPYVMEQARDDEVGIFGRFDPPGHHQTLQYVPADHGDQPCMLVIVIQGVAPADAFDGGPGKRTETFRQSVVRRAEGFAKVAGKKSSKLAGCRCRDRLHRFSPSEMAANFSTWTGPPLSQSAMRDTTPACVAGLGADPNRGPLQRGAAAPAGPAPPRPPAPP